MTTLYITTRDNEELAIEDPAMFHIDQTRFNQTIVTVKSSEHGLVQIDAIGAYPVFDEPGEWVSAER